MLGKVLGAVAGSQAAKYTSKFGGPGGALLGALAVPVVRRMKWTSLAALAAGGYVVKKLNEKGTGSRTGR